MRADNSDSRLTSVIISILIVLVIGAAALAPSDAAAFDGKRKGFILGGGLGYSPVLHWNIPDAVGETTGGFAGEFLIGFAWNDRNMIVYQSNLGIGSSDHLGSCNNFGQVYQGADYFHYFGRRGNALFVTGGIGLVDYFTQYENLEGDGMGYSLGAGYEFAKQMQVGVHYFGGSASGHGWDYRNDVLQVLFTVVAY